MTDTPKTEGMSLEQILEDWDVDAGSLLRNKTTLGDEALTIPKLHKKWLKVLAHERLRFRVVEAEYKQLKLAKHEFYTQGETTETRAKGWKFPSRGQILVKDVNLYMDADPQMIQMTLRVAYHAEIVTALEYIMTSLKGRNWDIGRAIDWEKHLAGN